MVRGFDPSSMSVPAVFGDTPAKMKAPKRAAVFDDPPWTIGSPWAAACHPLF
jgi:hypothetical protein